MTGARRKRFGVFAACFLLAVGLALFVLKLTRPPSGYIDIQYDGMSASGVFWKLENRSTQTIYVQGDGDRVWPGFAVTECRRFDYSEEGRDPPEIVDGFPSSIKVSPGARLRLNVVTVLPKQYKGGRCRLRLELLGGTFVESGEFIPK